MSTDSQTPSTGTGVKILLAWALVGVPLIWGVWHTLQNAVKLFR